MRDKFIIVVADDDVDDQELIKIGFRDCKVLVSIQPVYDGIRLMDYLLKKQEFRRDTDVPDLILLDLNMPLMDGFQALKEIQKYPHLKKIPIYVISTSRNKQDMQLAKDLGATGFYTKGASSRDITRIMREICAECFDELPGSAS